MKKAVFLDRDGVINKPVIIAGKPYPPQSLSELELLPGVKTGIEKLKEHGFMVFVVTNQPDVARGKTPAELVNHIHSHLSAELQIDKVYCCFHDDDDDCTCRKPKPGMLLQAKQDWNISLEKSFLVGDRWRDIACGIIAGVTTILIEYNYDEKKVVPDFSCRDFETAVEFILTPKLAI